MAKVVPQAANCREVEVLGSVYRRKPGGLFDMPDVVAEHVIKYEGGQEPALSGITRRGSGFRCVVCGFGSWFKTCSRCGGKCVRDAK